MRQIRITTVFFLTFFLLTIIGGCKEPSKSQSTQITNGCNGQVTQQNNTPFVTTLSIANQVGIPTTTFTQGEPISFTVAYANTSTTTQDIRSECHLEFEAVYICHNNGFVFTTYTSQWLPGCYSSSIFIPISPLTAGQSISLSPVVWNQKDYNNQQVPVGKYCAVAEAPGIDWVTWTENSPFPTVLGQFPSSKLLYFTIGP